MPIAKRLLLLILVLLLAGVALTCLLPVMVADGIRLFVLWKSRELGVKVEMGQIESPFFRPVIIDRFRLTTVRPCAFQVNLEAQRIELDLNLAALFSRSSGRLIHALVIDKFHGNIRRPATDGTETCRLDWRLLHRLLSDQLRLSDFNLEIENADTQIGLQHIDLTASDIESGKFSAGEIRLTSPLFHQQFANLLGATSWENERFTIGALSLARGLDVETITADFSGLEKKHFGFELNLDAFGGKLRASIASENRDKGPVWNVAGTASEISLEQMSTALGLTEPAGGSVHASKFTFRGDTRNLSRATASVWMEVTDFSWRDRSADTVMFGASLYNRQIDVSQLYVKQRDNQFTLTGEYALPSKSADWLNPNFRADISATIQDLGDFARLFGAPPNNFSGSLSIAGTLNGRDRSVGGNMTAHGTALLLFQMPADLLDARMSVKGSRLIVDELRANQGKDFVHGNGEVDLAGDHNYSAALQADISDLALYWPLFPARWQSAAPSGHVVLEWKATGRKAAHSGEFQIDGQHIQTRMPFRLLPLDVHVAGAYSPKNTSFREFRLSNQRAELALKATVAPNFFELHELRLTLDGQSKLEGHLTLPLAFGRWAGGERLLDTIDPNIPLDVDLNLEQTNLADLAASVAGGTGRTGNFAARWHAVNPLHSLQTDFEAHLRDYSERKSPATSADLTARVAANSLGINLMATFGQSDPVKFQANAPLQLDRVSTGQQNFFATDKPFSATADFPALFLANLPQSISYKAWRAGILSGKIVASHSLQNLQLQGEAQLLNGKFAPEPGSLTGLQGLLKLSGTTASLEFAQLELGDAKLPLHGAMDFTDQSRITAELIPDAAVSVLGRLNPQCCVSGVNFFPMKRMPNEKKTTTLFPEIQEIDLRGTLGGEWKMVLRENGNANLLAANASSSRAFSFCSTGGEILQLGVNAVPKSDSGRDVLSIFEGRRKLPEQAPNESR